MEPLSDEERRELAQTALEMTRAGEGEINPVTGTFTFTR